MSFAIYNQLTHCHICKAELLKHPATTGTDAGLKCCPADGDFYISIDLKDNPCVMYRRSKNDDPIDVTAFYKTPKKRTKKVVPKSDMPDWPGASKGATRGMGRTIYCNETDQIFRSIRTAARTLGVDETCISKVLHGTRISAKGYTFKYLGPPKEVLAKNTKPIVRD